MAVVLWDDSITESWRLSNDHALDVVLPMAGALREYNSIVVGEVIDMGDFFEKRYRALTDFLNKLVRFPIDFVQATLGAEFDAISAFRTCFESWHKDVEVGFKFDEVERELASVFGLPRQKRLSELVVDDYYSIVFEFDESSGVRLRVQLTNAVRSEPLLIYPFKDVAEFKPIDEAPLLKSVCYLTDYLMNPVKPDDDTDSATAISRSEQSRGTDASHAANQIQLAEALSPIVVTTEPPTPQQPIIVWNKILGVLTLNGQVVRKVRSAKVAKGIVSILDAFQEAKWASCVAPKFNGDEQRREAIRSLKDGLKDGGLIFEADGNDGIRWRLQDGPPA